VRGEAPGLSLGVPPMGLGRPLTTGAAEPTAPAKLIPMVIRWFSRFLHALAGRTSGSVSPFQSTLVTP
jgi:hypothetical protein